MKVQLSNVDILSFMADFSNGIALTVAKKYEEAVSQFKSSVEKTQQQYKDCHAELKASQQQVKLFDFNVFCYSYFFLNYCLFKKDSRTQNSNINK